MNKKNRLIVVDDHDMFRDGIKLLLSSGNQAEVIAEARNGKEFLEIIGNHNPDLVLMDIAMPEMDGIEATKIAHEKYPDLKILALTMFGDEKYYYQMIQSGIKGFVLKSSGISELLSAIEQVSSGGNFFSNELLVKLIAQMSTHNSDDKLDRNEHEKLSARETEVLIEIALGLSNDEIANKLNISAATVRTHRAKLLTKTGCTNTASLIMYAIKNKFIKVD